MTILVDWFQLKTGDAAHIHQTLLDFLKDLGLDMSRLVGFGSDGAAVMVGVRNGVATLLKQEVSSETHDFGDLA